MSSTCIASDDYDGAASWFSFTDPPTALSFFNNDLTESTLRSDECFITDDDGSDDESSIPSSYLTTFPDKALPLLHESESTRASSLDAQHDSSSTESVYNSDTAREESLTPIQSSKGQFPCSTSSSPSSDSDSDVSLINLPVSYSHDYSNSQESPSEILAPPRCKIVAAEQGSDMPSYHVHQLDWKHPVNAWEFCNRSEQHNQEIKALNWDVNHMFRSPHTCGTTKYNSELAEWRMLRRIYIMNEPTAQQEAQGHQLLERVAEIIQIRNRFFKKRELDSDD